MTHRTKDMRDERIDQLESRWEMMSNTDSPSASTTCSQTELADMRRELGAMKKAVSASRARSKAAEGILEARQAHQEIVAAANRMTALSMRALERSEASWNTWLGMHAARAMREERQERGTPAVSGEHETGYLGGLCSLLREVMACDRPPQAPLRGLLKAMMILLSPNGLISASIDANQVAIPHGKMVKVTWRLCQSFVEQWGGVTCLLEQLKAPQASQKARMRCSNYLLQHKLLLDRMLLPEATLTQP